MSGNAYMLVYKCAAWQPPADAPGAAAAAPPLAALPPAARARAAALAAEYEAACARYADLKVEAEARSAARQQEVRRVMALAWRRAGAAGAPVRKGAAAAAAAADSAAAEAPPPGEQAQVEQPQQQQDKPRKGRKQQQQAGGAKSSSGDGGSSDDGGGEPAPGFLVPTAWLEAWAGDDKPPGAPATRPLACAHGGLDPCVWQGVKYVGADAWAAMVVRRTCCCWALRLGARRHSLSCMKLC